MKQNIEKVKINHTEKIDKVRENRLITNKDLEEIIQNGNF